MPELIPFQPTTQLDIPNALAARYQMQQQQRAQDTQNAFSQALPMLQTDPQNALATVGRTGNIAAYSQLSGIVSQMDEHKKAQAADRADALGKLLYSLKAQYPDPAVRKAVAQSKAGELAVHGVTPDQIAGADYSDAGIQTAIGGLQSLKDQIAQADKDRTFNAGRSDHADTLDYQSKTLANSTGQLNVARGRLAVDQQKANQPDFNAPVTIEVPDGKGGTKQVLAQQNKKSGQWVSADEKRTPFDATGINLPDKSSGGARTQGQMIRMLSAGHTIANELENVVALPSGANAGIFSGQNDTSVRGMLAREVTPQEEQSYRAVNTGMSRALGQLEAAGLAPPGSLVSQMEGLTIKAGTPEVIALQQLAHTRQTAEGVLDSIANSPIATAAQKDEIKALKSRFAKAIPYTPQDVIKLQRKADPSAPTIGDRATKLGLGPQGAPGSPSGNVIHYDAQGNRIP